METSRFFTASKGLALASMVSSYTLGPLIIFGGLGWYLTHQSGQRIYIVVGVVAAFIVSNVLIIKNTTRIINFVKKR